MANFMESIKGWFLKSGAYSTDFESQDFLDSFEGIFDNIKTKIHDFLDKEKLGADISYEDIEKKLLDFINIPKIKTLFSEQKIKFDELSTAVEETGGWSEFFKESWNLEEINVEIYTLNETISWLKTNLDVQRHSAGCLYRIKEKANFLTGKRQSNNIHLCFIDKNNLPLLNGNDVHLIVHAKKLDADLQQNLGNKDMIIFK